MVDENFPNLYGCWPFLDLQDWGSFIHPSWMIALFTIFRIVVLFPTFAINELVSNLCDCFLYFQTLWLMIPFSQPSWLSAFSLSSGLWPLIRTHAVVFFFQFAWLWSPFPTSMVGSNFFQSYELWTFFQPSWLSIFFQPSWLTNLFFSIFRIVALFSNLQDC